jgi:K+-transporting ATPase ATPase A chain
MLAILLIPAALCYTFGRMVGDTRQGWAILAAMSLMFVGFLALAEYSEFKGNPAFTSLGIDQTASDGQAGGNMEGKETRFGIANSALWATATTAASNGSVNSMHDSYTPLGGLVPLWLIQLGEVVFGGVGSGLYGMLMFAIVAVFVAGLMIGLAMLFGRYWLAVPVLAIAGSLAAKKMIPAGLGTLPTHTPLFVVLLIGTVLMVGALNFIPALALKPVVEHLMMIGPK